MIAIQQLRNEHEGIRIMLNILRQVYQSFEMAGELNKDHSACILEFLGEFVEKNHRTKEEEILFPALTAAGLPRGPLEAMREEHEICESYISVMKEACIRYNSGDRLWWKGFTRSAESYVLLTGYHIQKENNLIFSMADNLLPVDGQDKLMEGFEKVEAEYIGPGRYGKFHHVAKNLGEIYLNGPGGLRLF